MSYSLTTSESSTFTISHARHITARIKTDLRRLDRYYPTGLTEQRIENFHAEATELLRNGYLKSVTYGFRIEEEDWFGDSITRWILALKYEVQGGELDGGSDSPGGIRAGKDVSGASFYSFLDYTQKFLGLPESERIKFKKGLAINRVSGTEPAGNWSLDRAYGQGGQYVNRLATYPG